jgi:flagellar hook-basal body protein
MYIYNAQGAHVPATPPYGPGYKEAKVEDAETATSFFISDGAGGYIAADLDETGAPTTNTTYVDVDPAKIQPNADQTGYIDDQGNTIFIQDTVIDYERKSYIPVLDANGRNVYNKATEINFIYNENTTNGVDFLGGKPLVRDYTLQFDDNGTDRNLMKMTNEADYEAYLSDLADYEADQALGAGGQGLPQPTAVTPQYEYYTRADLAATPAVKAYLEQNPGRLDGLSPAVGATYILSDLTTVEKTPAAYVEATAPITPNANNTGFLDENGMEVYVQSAEVDEANSNNVFGSNAGQKYYQVSTMDKGGNTVYNENTNGEMPMLLTPNETNEANMTIRLGDMTLNIDPNRLFNYDAQGEIIEPDTLGAYDEETLKLLNSGFSGTIGTIGLSEGEVLNIGCLVLAKFKNQAGLDEGASGHYSKTQNSGEAIYVKPGLQGTGSLRSSSLEMSNVDLSKEMTDMITTQRGFQANSRIITVSDTMLEELVNLKR